MKNKTNHENAADNSCHAEAVQQLYQALGALTGKWKGEILWQLGQGKHRFGTLQRSIPGITQHMLKTQLRDLEANGLVKRTVYPEIPLRVEYEITASAKALRPVFDELFRWSREYGLPLTERKESRGKLP